MGRYNLQHLDRGIIYLPVGNDMSEDDVNTLIEEYKALGKTIVLFKSGKYNMKYILQELLKTRLET